jgi:hypothetical protein
VDRKKWDGDGKVNRTPLVSWEGRGSGIPGFTLRKGGRHQLAILPVEQAAGPGAVTAWLRGSAKATSERGIEAGPAGVEGGRYRYLSAVHRSFSGRTKGPTIEVSGSSVGARGGGAAGVVASGKVDGSVGMGRKKKGPG